MLYKQPYKKTAFQVRKPIRSFRDLEVYQRAAGAATEVMVKVMSLLAEGSSLVKERYILLRRKTFNLYKKAWMRFSGKQEPVSEHGYSQGLG